MIMESIKDDIAYYKENRAAFVEEYPGKHLVIKGQQVVGVYNSNTEAVHEALRLHETGTYIIERPMALKANKNNIVLVK